ncbi:MAG TPA: hypothetical protein VN715_10485 [Roseiarcus sp.]|nr:hypothetical protein [Roseiarcus sp.]
MSLTNDAVNAWKNTFLTKASKQEPPPLTIFVGASPPTAPTLLDQSLLSEAQLAAGELLARAESAEQSRDEIAKNLALSKRLQQSMLRRVQPMIGALREKGAESARLSDTLSDFERRFLTYQTETGRARPARRRRRRAGYRPQFPPDRNQPQEERYR